MVRGRALPCPPMAKRYSAGTYRLIGRVGTSRLISRLHPHARRADRRIPVVVLGPVAED